jgi:hypothetical protein
MPRTEPPGRRATRAIERMVEYAPATGGLALWVRHIDGEESGEDAAPVTTDGHSIRYAKSFEALPLAQKTGWVAHAVLHVALRHAQRLAELRARVGDVDAALFNVCADAIVNSALGHLGWLELPDGAVRLERVLADALDVRQSAEAALLEWNVERLYRAIDDRTPPREARDSTARSDRQARGGAGPAAGGGRSGDDSPSDRDGPRVALVRALGASQRADLLPVAGDGEAPEDRAESVRTWGERMTRAHAGDGEFSMLRALLADLPVSRTPWEQALRTRLAGALDTRPSLSWSRPSRSYLANQSRRGHRRMPWEPGTAGQRRVARLAVVVDVSGSIDDALLQRFAGEIEAITRRREAELVLVVGDDRVRRVEVHAPGRSGLRELAFDGGGGTDFAPLLEAADAHAPDIGVVLTDLEGPASFRPRWPVVWAVPESHAAARAPFGRLLVLS